MCEDKTHEVAGGEYRELSSCHKGYKNSMKNIYMYHHVIKNSKRPRGDYISVSLYYTKT